MLRSTNSMLKIVGSTSRMLWWVETTTHVSYSGQYSILLLSYSV